MKINNKRQLQNIATNHFADIDYRDFEKIDKECTKEPHSFFTIDTTLPASDHLGFRKKLFLFYKIRVTDQFEMLDQKIKQHEAQYDLDRKAAKLSALHSGNLDKYEYFTGEDVNYKPNTADQTR